MRHVVGHKAFRGPRADPKSLISGTQDDEEAEVHLVAYLSLPPLWPYVMPVHQPWMYAYTAYNLHSFLRACLSIPYLLEILLQMFGITYKWFPTGFYWGKIGMHIWTVIALGYPFTVVERIRSAICGMYADVPSDPQFVERMPKSHLYLLLPTFRFLLINQDLYIDHFRWLKCHLFAGIIFSRKFYTPPFQSAFSFHFPLPFQERHFDFILNVRGV